MLTSGPASKPNGKLKVWLIATVGGLLAIVAGIMLPQTLATDATLKEADPKQKPQQPTPLKSEVGGPKEKDSLTYSPPAWPEPPSADGMISRLVLGTVLVLVLCGGTLWIGKRWLGNIRVKDPAAGRLGVLETLPLGRRGSLVLVKVGVQQILVGLDHAGIKGMVALAVPFEGALDEIQMRGALCAGLEKEAASAASAEALEEQLHA